MSDQRFVLAEKEQQKNQLIINGFRADDWSVIQLCYKEVYDMVQKLVKNNSGNADDARTLLFDSFKVFKRQCSKAEFELTGKFSTYIYSVCYKLWLKQLQRRRRDALYYTTDLSQHSGSNSSDDPDDSSMDDQWGSLIAIEDATEETLSIRQLYDTTVAIIAAMGKTCKEVLLLYGEEKSHRDIATQLHISEAASRKRLFDCKETLANRIRQSPYFNEMMQHPNIKLFIEKYVKDKR